MYSVYKTFITPESISLYCIKKYMKLFILVKCRLVPAELVLFFYNI